VPTSDTTNHTALLTELRQELQDWRSAGRPNKRIPARIWEESVALATQLGVSAVAREVGLCYGLLKSRSAGRAAQSCLPSASFVEIFQPPGASSATCVLKIQPRRGGRVRIELAGLATSDLVSVIRELLA
jgi:hypothetical protein